jgi:2-polyprenyl-3-methyl-5-hydroxy-6-metoxy-1,4-benzoquinol methylase
MFRSTVDIEGDGPRVLEDPEAALRAIADDADIVPEAYREWWSNYLVNHHDRYLVTFDIIRSLGEGKRILEVGCLPGHLTVLLRKAGLDVQGIDLDPTRIQPLWDEHGIEVDTGDIESEPLPYDEDSYDLIIFTEMLEHLRVNPLHSVREMARVLRPGGLLLLSTPNITPLHRVGFLFGRDYQGDPVKEFGKLERIGHMGHVRLYSTHEVVRILEHAGLSVEEVRYEGRLDLRGRGRLVHAFHPRKREFKRYLFVLARRG